MVSALWLWKWEWNCGMRRPPGRRIPPLMAPMFAVAVVHRVRCTGLAHGTKVTNGNFRLFHLLLSLVHRRPACRLSAQRWEERVGGFTVVGESLSGQINAFGMVAWFSKSAVADRFRAADSVVWSEVHPFLRVLSRPRRRRNPAHRRFGRRCAPTLLGAFCLWRGWLRRQRTQPGRPNRPK
jgi:hypothetical protein